jgi:hypothetical protein
MAFALRLLLIIFMINTMLFLGLPEYHVGDKILGKIFTPESLNTDNPQPNTEFSDIVPNTTSYNQIGVGFGLLFTPVVLLFQAATLFISFFAAPLELFNIAGMPVIFKIIFGGGLFIAEVILLLSMITGRDI